MTHHHQGSLIISKSAGAFKFTALNQLARLALGPLVFLLLPFFLTIEQQGYWFSMISIAAILAFADMGLSIAIMHCAAHEHAYSRKLETVDPGGAQGDCHRRLETLFAYSMRRVGKITIVALPAVTAIGIFTFSSKSDTVHWFSPWLGYCLASAAALMLSVILSFHEGCDGVASVQRIRLTVSITNLAMMSVCLVAGLDLWSLSIATTASTAVGAFLVSRCSVISIASALKINKSELVAWSKEVSPLLSKYALSWIGGYLMFQLFVPIVLLLDGPEAAGRAGLTFSIFSAIFTLSNVWSTYQLPKFSMAIALQDNLALRACLKRSLYGGISTYIGFASFVIGAIYILNDHAKIVERLQPMTGILSISLIWLLQLLVHNLAIYLRAFKEEPLVCPTIIGAAHSVVATALCVHFLSSGGYSLGLLSVYFWFLPVVIYMYVLKRDLTVEWPSQTT